MKKLEPQVQADVLVNEAFELISTHMWAALTPDTFQKLSKLPFFLDAMRKIIPLGLWLRQAPSQHAARTEIMGFWS